MRVGHWKNIPETHMSAVGKCCMNSSPDASEPNAAGRTRTLRTPSQLLPSPRRLTARPTKTPSSPLCKSASSYCVPYSEGTSSLLASSPLAWRRIWGRGSELCWAYSRNHRSRGRRRQEAGGAEGPGRRAARETFLPLWLLPRARWQPPGALGKA